MFNLIVPVCYSPLGVYYNGLLLNDLAAGLSYLPFIQVARFGKVEYVPTFQPLLPTSRSVDE